jgi:hypothetical protein
MNLFNIFTSKKQTQVEVQPYQNNGMAFSTPFGKIGKGDLSLPYIKGYNQEQFVRFGTDNLFPQIINQLYHQSPLNGAIINFKTNAVVGGGYSFINNTNVGKDLVAQLIFEKKNKLKKLVKQITKDFVMHNRICIIVNKKENGEVSFKRVGPEKVRNNSNLTLFTVCDDWASGGHKTYLKAYDSTIIGESLYEYSLVGDAGQDIYPIPSYTSSFNSAYLSAEIPLLQKSSIINSIFPSFMLTMVKKFGSDKEAKQFKEQIDNAKGAQEAGRILAMVVNNPDEVPTLTAIPINNNDKLFTETIENAKAEICFSHQIDAMIMGVRVPGKLGSGAELPIAYSIFEKNVVMPLRNDIEDFINDLLLIANVPGQIKINDFQLIEGELKDKTIL